MSLFHTILEDITKQLRSVEGNKDDIANVVSTILGVPVSANQLQIKQNTLFISTSPTIKSAIRLKQTALLRELQIYKITTIG